MTRRSHPSGPRRSRTDFRVHVHELGPDGRLSLLHLANFLQQAAGDHVERLGFTAERMLRAQLAWVLTRQRIQTARLPSAGTPIVVETWASHRERQFFRRQFRVLGPAETVRATAASAWTLFDVSARRSVEGPSWVAQALAYDAEQVLGFPAPTIPRLREGEHQHERWVRPRWSDLDLNRHVNNAQLFGWTLEALPRDLLDRGRLLEIDLIMRAECRLEDEIRARALEVAAGRFRHHLVRAADGREVARAETLWELAP